MGEDWGVETMSDVGVREMEDGETARTRFLESGPGLQNVGGDGSMEYGVRPRSA